MATKGDRRNALDQMGLFFERAIEMPPGLKDLNNERARDEVFRSYLNIDEYLFRPFATLSDGDPVPNDFLFPAFNAYVVNGGVSTSLTYAEPEDIPHLLTNSVGINTASNPYYTVIGGHFQTFPAAISSVQFEYYAKPVAMYSPGNDIGIPLSTADNMPSDAEPLITRSAYARSLQMLLEEPELLKVNKDVLLNQIKENSVIFSKLADNLDRKAREQ